MQKFLLVDFHANHFQMPAIKKANQIIETCGRNSGELLATINQNMWLLKMFQDYLIPPENNHHTPPQLLQTLPKWGSTHHGDLYRQVMPDYHTNVNVGGVLPNWATPQQTDYKRRTLTQKTLVQRIESDRMNVIPYQLRKSPNAENVNWQTPTINGNRPYLTKNEVGRRMDPKTNASQHVGIQIRKKDDGSYNLSRDVSPNPVWVELLMGLPPEWTNPDVSNQHIMDSIGCDEPRKALKLWIENTPIVAGRFQSQHEWEPPRLVPGKSKYWYKRFSVLGNGHDSTQAFRYLFL